jgi:hypothetical protein
MSSTLSFLSAGLPSAFHHGRLSGYKLPQFCLCEIASISLILKKVWPDIGLVLGIGNEGEMDNNKF